MAEAEAATRERNRQRQYIGRLGEETAQRFLEERCGCRIVDANVRFGKTSGLIGEIDIVAWDGATLCFVEVKTRRGAPSSRAHEPTVPAEAVTPAKQRQIARLALAYAVRHGLLDGDAEIPLRFDVVSVFLNAGDTPKVRRVDRIVGAFLAEDGLTDGD